MPGPGAAVLVKLQQEFKWPDDITQVLDVDAMSLT